MDSRWALLVACLVALAGCSVGPLGDDSEPETVTPVAVDATASQETPVPVEGPPPGVAPNGTVDSEALRAAHHRALGNQSYTWTVVGSTAPTKDNNQSVSRRVTVEGDEILVEETRSARSGNVSLYVNGSFGYVRSNTGDGIRFLTVPRPLPNRTYAFGGSLVAEFLDGVTVETEVVQRDEQPLYRLKSTDDPPDVVDRPGRTVRDFSATAFVRPSGFVRTLVVEYDQRTDHGWREFSFRFDYSRLGESSVTEPDWVSTARADAQPARPSPESSWSGTQTATPTERAPTAQATTERATGTDRWTPTPTLPENRSAAG